MKHKLWITVITCLAYCIDRELWKAIEYLKEQVSATIGPPINVELSRYATKFNPSSTWNALGQARMSSCAIRH